MDGHYLNPQNYGGVFRAMHRISEGMIDAGQILAATAGSTTAAVAEAQHSWHRTNCAVAAHNMIKDALWKLSPENEALARLGGIPDLVIVRTGKRTFVLREELHGRNLCDATRALRPFAIFGGSIARAAIDVADSMGWRYISERSRLKRAYRKLRKEWRRR